MALLNPSIAFVATNTGVPVGGQEGLRRELGLTAITLELNKPSTVNLYAKHEVKKN